MVLECNICINQFLLWNKFIKLIYCCRKGIDDSKIGIYNSIKEYKEVFFENKIQKMKRVR